MVPYVCQGGQMIINKYGNTKTMIKNNDGTYCFLNVSFWEVIKFYITHKLTGETIKERTNAQKESSGPKNMDR